MGFTERLSRNMAIAAVFVICAAALRTARENPTAQAVFDSIQDQVEWELDDSLGRLSFVSHLLPEASMVFWNDPTDIQVLAPVEGEIRHVWTAGEPYLTMDGEMDRVRCAAEGEVMSVAHGDREEIVIRVRHTDCLETVYGNLEECSVSVGDKIPAGHLLGRTFHRAPVYFELRQDGRPIDPTYLMQESGEQP